MAGTFLLWFSVLIQAAMGAGILFVDFPNVWLKLGVGLLIFAAAFRPALFAPWTRRHIEPIVVIRVWVATNVLAWAFGLIGALTWGGALGWVFAFLCLYVGLLRWGWLFHQLRAQPASDTGASLQGSSQ